MIELRSCHKDDALPDNVKCAYLGYLKYQSLRDNCDLWGSTLERHFQEKVVEEMTYDELIFVDYEYIRIKAQLEMDKTFFQYLIDSEVVGDYISHLSNIKLVEGALERLYQD